MREDGLVLELRKAAGFGSTMISLIANAVWQHSIHPWSRAPRSRTIHFI
jgi:hypothetical protein